MLAVEFAILSLIQLFPPKSHFLINSDNQGVVFALKSFYSRSLLQNESLSRILSHLLDRQSFLSALYIPSDLNPADPISRGVFPPLSLQLRTPITIHDSVSRYFVCK